MTDLPELYTPEIKAELKARYWEFLKTNIANLVNMVEDPLLKHSFVNVVHATTEEDAETAWKKTAMSCRLSWPELFDYVDVEWEEIETSVLIQVAMLQLPTIYTSEIVLPTIYTSETVLTEEQKRCQAWLVDLQARRVSAIKKIDSASIAFAARVREQTRQDL